VAELPTHPLAQYGPVTLACRLTSTQRVGQLVLCCSACRRGMRRPPPDHLEVPSTELSRRKQAVAVSISVPDRWEVRDESVPDPRVDLVSFREEFCR